MNAGEKGERLALEYLLKRGYTLRAKNYQAGHREIDLILEDREGVIVFVEVKARSSLRYGLPREAVGRATQNLVREAAQSYLLEQGLHDRYVRFDVTEVYLSENRIEHIVNAF